MLSERLDKIIPTVPDFPKEGINFKDITPLLMDSDISSDISSLSSDIDTASVSSAIKSEYFSKTFSRSLFLLN